MTELISVLIPVFNGEAFLPACLDSIAVQTHREFEIVIVDDGSNDQTLDICRAFIKDCPQLNVKLIEQDHLGVSAARNRAIEEASGDIIAFIDADDVVAPEYLATLYAPMRKHRVDMVCCGVILTNQNGDFIYQWPLNPYFTERVLNTIDGINAHLIDNIRPESWSCLVKRELYNQNRIRYPEGRFFEDRIPSLELVSVANGIYIVNQHLYRYRKNPTGTVHTVLTNPNVLRDRYPVIFEYADRVKKYEINRMFFYCYISHWLNDFRTHFFEYQNTAYRYSVISGEIDYNRKLAFYGAGYLGVEYVKLNGNRFTNCIFVDHDPSKKSLMGYPVVRLDEYCRSYSGDYKLVLTCKYMFSVAQEMLDCKAIDSLEQLMLYDGALEVEKQLAHAFSLCLAMFDDLENENLRKQF